MTTTLFITQFKPRLVLDERHRRTNQFRFAHRRHHCGRPPRTNTTMAALPAGGMGLSTDEQPGQWQRGRKRVLAPSGIAVQGDAALASYQGPQVTANGETYTVKARRGVVSSSIFSGVTQQRIDQLRSRFHTDIMEMESAPLGHVCETLGVPYLIVRAGSNVAQEAPNDRLSTARPIAAREAAKFSLHLLGIFEGARCVPREPARSVKMSSEPIEKIFISANSLLRDSIELGLQVVRSGFGRPSWSPSGAAVHRSASRCRRSWSTTESNAIT